VSFEGGQGQEEAAVPHMDGWRCYGMEMNVGITNIVRISRQPSPKQIIYQNKLENVEYFKYLKRMMQEVHVNLNSGFPWQKQHSTRTRLLSPANWA
jgi:hypothetical protein